MSIPDITTGSRVVTAAEAFAATLSPRQLTDLCHRRERGGQPLRM